MQNHIVSSIVLALAASTALHAQTFKTVGVYDAPTHANAVDVFLPSNAFYAGFNATLAAAFPANRGGVINFDSTHSSPWNAAGVPVWKAIYGSGFLNVCNLSFAFPVKVGNMVGQPWTPISGSPNGPGALTAVGLTPISFKVAAPLPIRYLGLTVLQRVGVAQKVVVTFVEAGGAVISQSLLIPAGAAGALPAQDTFVGAKAVNPAGLVSVEVRAFNVATGAILSPAIDDLAFLH